MTKKNKFILSARARKRASDDINQLHRRAIYLMEKYEIYDRPPYLCDFCTEFWCERFEEADCGCRANQALWDDTEGEVLSCHRFNPYKSWDVMAERRLVSLFEKSLETMYPLYSGIRKAKFDLDSLNKKVEIAESKLKQSYERFEYMWNWKKLQLEKFLPADALARIYGVPERSLIHIELTDSDIQFEGIDEVSHQ
jgi:hypothetical protein